MDSLTERFIDGYNHEGRIGVMVEFAAGSDFVFRTAEFKQLAADIALHIAAVIPSTVEELPVEELLSQPFIKATEFTVAEHLSSIATPLREQLEITRFVRWDTVSTPDPGAPNDPEDVVAALKVS